MSGWNGVSIRGTLAESFFRDKPEASPDKSW